MNLNKILTVSVFLVLFIVIANIIVGFIPWYSQELPSKTTKTVYCPGDVVGIIINRNSFMGMKATNVIELVHISKGFIKEIYRYKKDLYLQKGRSTIQTFHRLPTLEMSPQMEYNTYRWQGIITYHVFGYLERSFTWKTTNFLIEANKSK